MLLVIIVSVRTSLKLDAFRRVNLVKIKHILALNVFKYVQEYSTKCSYKRQHCSLICFFTEITLNNLRFSCKFVGSRHNCWIYWFGISGEQTCIGSPQFSLVTERNNKHEYYLYQASWRSNTSVYSILSCRSTQMCTIL